MKLKQIIFALVAIMSSFSVSVWAQTTVTAAAELTEALANGGEVTLGADITVNETQTIPAGVSVTLDLNGKTVSQSKACVASYEMILNKGNLTIKNGTVRFTDTSEGDPTFGWGSYTVRNEGTLVVEDDATIEHLGKQAFATHMICAIFQYSGSTTINGGKISTPNYRSIRLWKGDMTINGGTFDGQLWVQAVDNSAKLTINAGTFEPNGNDASSVFVGNDKYDVEFAVAGGTFNGKIGCSDATKLAGAISGGKFNEGAKSGTNSALLASGFIFGEAGTDGYYAVEDAPATHYIATLEDLKALRDAVNSGTNYYDGVNVYLTADIDLAGENWVGIGSATAEHGFMGNFDGKGYTIKNLTITEPALDSYGYAYAGLFAVTEGADKDNQNTIKNLTIENVTINTTGHIVSAAIAYPYYTIVDNIQVCGDIKIQGGNYTAGVLAYTRRCVNASNLSIVGEEGSFVTGNQTVGGVISDIQMNGGLTAVYNNFSAEGLTISGTKQVGGISGIIATQTLNGASVKNVALECSDARVGIVAGCLGGTSTISNVTYENVTGAAALIGATYDNAKPVAAKIGDTYYATFENAYKAAQEGETITMLAPVVIAAGETLTLDKNITIAYASNVAGEDMFTNRGTLNISAGTITYANTDATASNVTVSTISCEPGSVLNITGGTVENKTVKADGSSIYSYAIDMLTNGNLGDVTATIAGGKVYSDYMAIRQFNNGTVCKNTLNITGGHIYGAKRAVQVHMDNNAASTTISGGKIEAGDYSLCNFASSGQFSVTGGEFIGAVYSALDRFISGGTFASEIDAAYCAEGFVCQQNADGTFGIVKANAGLSGDGTEASPYLINNVADLVLFRNSVNAGETTYSAPGVWVALAADIDLAGENWVGIGSATAEHGFMGNFDGKGYTIKNLTITDPALDSDGYAYAGLFAVTEGTDKNNQNTIKNLIIENVTINTTGHIVSAAIAYPYYTIVDNIKVCGDININGGNYTAGVLAYTRRCVNASNLAITGKDGSSVNGSQTVGGVISDIQMNGGLVADYKYFSADGLAITGAMHVGGISGIISGQTLTGATVKNVNLTCTDARVGLVAGSLGDASAISVVVTENVTGATALIGAGYKSAKAVEAKIGDKYFTTLEDALAAEGNKVELLVPYVVADDDEIVLDLKGKTVTGTPSEAKAYSAITNNGNLTIINGTLLCNHTLTGSTGYAVNTITNCGILTIDGATIQNTSTASNQIGYAIDNNSTSTNAIVTIKSGNVVASGSNYYDGIRQFCNSLTKDNSVIVKGGEVSSIWMQNPSDGAEKNTKDVKGSISISGGTVNILSLEPSTNFQAAVTGGHVGEISYFQEAEGRNLVKFITGGTFGMDVTKFCADYHNCTSNENGVYEVKPDANYIAEYIIDDAKGENYTSAEKKVVGTLTYKRTLPNAEKWNPLYVPFAIPMSKLIENYDVAYFNDVRGNDANNDNVVDDGTLKMELVMIDNPDVTLNANYPFVFRAKTEEAKNLELVLDNATLYENTENSVVFTSLDIKCEVKGSYRKCKTGDNQYIVNTNGLWSPLNQDYDLKPYRLILTLSSNNNLKPFAARDIRMFVIGEEAEDGTTHIFDVENDAQTQDSIYDLQGRRVLTPQKGGLYIVNGKKTVIR